MTKKRNPTPEERAEKRRISARERKELRNELGLAAREPQAEAYEIWAAWDAQLDEEVENGSSNHSS